MKLYLENIPKWVFQESNFLKSYLEDFKEDYIEIFIFQEDINEKVKELFQKEILHLHPNNLHNKTYLVNML